MKETPLIMIDCSALKDIFEGKKSGDKLLKKINDLKYQGSDINIYTPLSSFLRAIYLTNPKLKINSIQKTLNFLVVLPSFADFKNKKEVTNEIITLTKTFSTKVKK